MILEILTLVVLIAIFFELKNCRQLPSDRGTIDLTKMPSELRKKVLKPFGKDIKKKALVNDDKKAFELENEL